jgi:hypothetical protein
MAASTTTTLAGEEKLDAKVSRVMLDPRSEQSDLNQSANSTRVPSTFEDEKKTGDASSSDQEKADVEVSSVEDEAAKGEYPTGSRLAFIVVALVISMFLVALDMVGLPQHNCNPTKTKTNFL